MSTLGIVLGGLAAVLAVGWLLRAAGGRVNRAASQSLERWAAHELADLEAEARSTGAALEAELRFERRGERVELLLSATLPTAKRSLRKDLDWSEVPEAVRARLAGIALVKGVWTPQTIAATFHICERAVRRIASQTADPLDVVALRRQLAWRSAARLAARSTDGF